MNAAKFMQNGNCGFVLKPDYMLKESFSPYDPSSLKSLGVEPTLLAIRILAARHLCKKKTSFKCPRAQCYNNNFYQQREEVAAE